MASNWKDCYCHRMWTDSIIQEACQLLAEDLPLASGAPGGQVEYRRSLASSFFFKFYLNVSQQLCNGEVRFDFLIQSNKRIFNDLLHDYGCVRCNYFEGEFSQEFLCKSVLELSHVATSCWIIFMVTVIKSALEP